MIDVPDRVRNMARAAGAEGWLERLPVLVSGLEADWSIAVGRPYTGGSGAYVAEATVLRIVGGEGCPALYRHDADRGALLMERLGRPMFELGLPLSRRLEILCDTAAGIWRPAPDCGLPTGAEKARSLADFIERLWAELDHPCSEKAIDHALVSAPSTTWVS